MFQAPCFQRTEVRRQKTEARSEKPEAKMPAVKITQCFATRIKVGKLMELGKNQVAGQLEGNAVALMAFD